MTRRRITASLNGHHWPQPRALLPLVERRAFRADTRRGFGFAPSPRWVCTRCGMESFQPGELCVPQPIEVVWISSARARPHPEPRP